MNRYIRYYEQSKGELVIVNDNGSKYPLYINPNSSQRNALLDRHDTEYPNAPKRGERGYLPSIRTTYDKKGNEFMWMSGDAIHYNVEQYLLKTKGIKADQNWG